MSKSALREQRRAQRIARRNRQRAIIAGIIVLILALIAFFAIRDYTNRLASASPTPTSTSGGKYAIGTLDPTPPALSASAVTTTSGLKYEDLQAGDGATVKAGDTISVNYTGWLENGTKFDSSIDRGSPSEFQIGVGQVIAGWDEGIPGMKVGGTRLLVIPGNLAYGASGRPPTIPANATLIFEVQIVAIK